MHRRCHCRGGRHQRQSGAASCGRTVSSSIGSGSPNCRRTATSSAKPLPADVPRGRPIDFSATTLQLDVHVGDVSAAGLDAYSLGSAVGRERDPGAKGGGAQFAFEAACGDTSSHVTGYVSRSFLPVSLDPLAGSFDVAGDVKLEAFARAHNRLDSEPNPLSPPCIGLGSGSTRGGHSFQRSRRRPSRRRRTCQTG